MTRPQVGAFEHPRVFFVGAGPGDRLELGGAGRIVVARAGLADRG